MHFYKYLFENFLFESLFTNVSIMQTLNQFSIIARRYYTRI